MRNKILLFIPALVFAQNPQKLTLEQAVAAAIQNHPQIQAAQNEVNYAQQQIVINRAPYYPALSGEVTGSQGNDLARIGAGEISASRLFNRFGSGVVLSQLITDSGRTSSLVSSARFQEQASQQNLSATRYNIVLAVNRYYYDVLHAEAVVKVAQETIAARQLVSDQVTELAKNSLKTQLDVSFADTNVAEAKLLLIRAQEAVQDARAQLGRAMGSDQPADSQLDEPPAAPGLPANPDGLITQALANRPELAGLRFSRESAYKFYEAEKDLSRPTVSLAATAGIIPYINTPASSPIPIEYEGVAANVSIPLFNGHLFSARREAARQRAMESDQRLRDEQERLARDVRVAYSAAVNAYQRIDVTAQFLRAASMGVDLAKGRFDLGLATIIELTTAQLNLTAAEVENLSAKYDYQNQYAALQFTIGNLR